MTAHACSETTARGPVEVRAADARGILTATRGFTSVDVPGAGFDFTLNPYRGCAFNCTYCYAPAFIPDEADRAAWGRWVQAKQNAAELLRDAGRRGRLCGKNVYMSTVTDPYQPVERRLGLTRACLEVLVAHPPRLLTVQTRSPLVTRDIDLFQRLSGRIAVCMSITTDDEAVRRAFEPACAPIAARLAAIAEVRAAGVPTQASVAPLLPCDPERLAALLDPAVDWVVVSSFRDDGARGGKTRRLAAERYRELGYGDYLRDGDRRADEAVATLRRLLGPERVRVGKDGFDQVCRELGVDEPRAEQLALL